MGVFDGADSRLSTARRAAAGVRTWWIGRQGGRRGVSGETFRGGILDACGQRSQEAQFLGGFAKHDTRLGPQDDRRLMRTVFVALLITSRAQRTPAVEHHLVVPCPETFGEIHRLG